MDETNLEATITSPYAKNGANAQPQSTENVVSPRKPKKEALLLSKYDTRLAEAALRQAAEGGYLISPSRAFLLERCQTTEKQTRSLREIEYIHLAHFHIRALGHIQSCRHIRVCILHHNYLTRFNALENCPLLMRLDLHSNQITKLPDEQFWSEMKNLKILNLHDNNIGNLESIQFISACQSLTVLTLYNTPLSLKNNYRHHTVNSIWSLKALDHHVIGDDEIIEDALFSKKFCALNPKLFVELCPKEIESVHERTIEMEVATIKKILSDINRILVHGSPVVVIQRWVRGYLCRKRRNVNYFDVNKRMNKLFSQTRPRLSSQGEETMGLDYDTYLKNRRPGSKSSSITTSQHPPTPMKKPPTSAPESLQTEDLTIKYLPPYLHINLAKLEQNALRSFDNTEENITIVVQRDNELPNKSLFSKPLAVKFEKEKKISETPTKGPAAPNTTPATAPGRAHRKEPITVQQMLGPTEALVHPMLAQSHPTLGTLVEGGKMQQQGCKSDEEIPNHEWRIHDKAFQVAGGKPVFAEMDPIQDQLIMNREAGRDVRDAIEYWHDRDMMRPKPRARTIRPPPRLKDQVSLATLVAVSKAYRDRDKTDHLAVKVDKVMRIQQERVQSKHIVAAFKEEKRVAALTQRQDDRIRVTEALQNNGSTRASYIEYAQERRERTLQRHRVRHSELMFASDFGNQHTSVSNALIRHDRQAAKEDEKGDKTDVVNGVKLQLAEQSELVRRYMEHKQVMRQMTGGQEKSRLDAKVLQEASDRILAARQRVAGLKARKAAVQAYQHSIPTTADPGSWVITHQPHQSAPLPSRGEDPKLPQLNPPYPTLHIHDNTSRSGAGLGELPPVGSSNDLKVTIET